jgi:predicted transcriptional regulator
MFGWFSKKRISDLEENTRNGFSSVKKDIDSAGKWIKHLDANDQQLFDITVSLKNEITSLRDEIESLREGVDLAVEEEKGRQVFKKLPVLEKQTGVEDVQKTVQTAVQTDNIYGILKGLSGNERLVVFTLLNSDMKLSYEDLALLLGKERSTVRGQVNSIKQKSEGLIEEVSEKNGKKRIFIPENVRAKLQKYAKVRTQKQGKNG